MLQVHGTLSMIQDRLKGAKMRAGDVTYDVMLGRQTLLNCAAFLGYGERDRMFHAPAVHCLFVSASNGWAQCDAGIGGRRCKVLYACACLLDANLLHAHSLDVLPL
jgi:hypothetical protein